MSAPLLSVEGLTTVFPAVRFGVTRHVRAVDGVSLTVDRGETLALVGESGCGKTITALSLVGLVPPPGRVTAGRIVFDGQDVTRASERDWRARRGSRIGFVFQEPGLALNPVFTIGDHVADALAGRRALTRDQRRARIHDLLAAVGLPSPVADAYPHELSGGQRQRALVAAALAGRPALLVADEPTTALDPTVQAELLDLLRDLRLRFELALLIITHDLGVVSALADRLAVMYAGRIVETGPAAAVLTTPRHPYTAGLLASVPGLSPGERLRAIPGAVPDLSALPEGCAFAPRCPERRPVCEAQRPELLASGPDVAVRCVLREGRA